MSSTPSVLLPPSMSARPSTTLARLSNLAVPALALLASLAFALSSAAAANAVSFSEAGFQSVPLASGLDLPTAVTWAPDGRMFIAEKEGYVRVVEPDGTLLPEPIVDIHDHVIPSGDRGLIGIAVAPIENSTNVTLYLLYDYYPGGAVGTGENTVATATLTSVTVEADNKAVGGKLAGGKEGVDPTETPILGKVNSPGSEYGLACASESLDCIPADGFTHSIGTVLFDPEEGGSLWIGSGDGLNDFGAENEPLVTRPLHIRAQNPESLAGKILHVKLDGSGYPNSPFCANPADTTSNCSKVYASGFRNPFRFTLRQFEGKSTPVIGDVGEGHWEEVDLANSRGFNGGWPCYEGKEANPDFSSTSQCTKPTTAFSAPLFVYTHFNDECTYPGAPTPCDQNNEPGAAVASAGIYSGKEYPAGYEGKLFVADYVNGWLSTVDLESPPQFGYSSGRGMPLTATELGELVDTVQAPDGNLVYVTLSVESETALGLGSVREIHYTPADSWPVVEPEAESSCVNSSTSSRQVNFIGDDSYDPDGDTTLRYRWEFGDGKTSSEPNPVHTYTADGNYEVRLTVTDSHNNSASGFLAVHIHPGQEGQPAADIKAPEESREYIAGVSVQLSGDNKTAGARSQWQIVEYHGFDVAKAMPPIETGTEGDAELHTPTAPTSNISFALRFVSSNGTCTTTISDILNPQVGQLTLRARDSAGNQLPVPLSYNDSTPEAAPTQLSVVKNTLANVIAPQNFSYGGETYEFTGWSDGGGREHAVRVFEYPEHASEETQTLTALYAKAPVPVQPITEHLPSELMSPPPTPPNPPKPPAKGTPPRVSLNAHSVRSSALSGTALDPAGVRSLKLAIHPDRIKGKGCSWWSVRRRRFVRASRSCKHVPWSNAGLSTIAGGSRWTLPLGRRLPPGRYRLLLSAAGRDGLSSSRFVSGTRSGGLLVVP